MQFQLLKLLTAGMEVNPTNTPDPLIEANIIEPLKTGPTNRLDPMVRNKKQLFPAHEQVVLPQVVLQREGGVEVGVGGGGGVAGRFQVFAVQRPEGREAGPVL